MACIGIAQNVQNQQTKSGIKDSYTQFWIDDLILRARTFRKADPMRTTVDIQSELLGWVNNNRNDIINPFLTLDGAHLLYRPFFSNI